MAKMKALDGISILLLVIGGINWGLVGALNFDLVQFLLGSIPLLARAVYVLVGLSGLYGLYFLLSRLVR